MSMLSVQVESLRVMARLVRDYDPHEVSRALREAADIIDRLRCDTSLLLAENVKLRELVRIMHSELVSCEDNGYICGGHKFDGRVRELGIEVAE